MGTLPMNKSTQELLDADPQGTAPMAQTPWGLQQGLLRVLQWGEVIENPKRKLLQTSTLFSLVRFAKETYFIWRCL